MSRKFNTRHPERGHGGYLRRLAKRGLTSAPRMDSREHLEDVQEKRTLRTGFPWWTPRSDPVTIEDVTEVVDEVTEEVA